MPEAQVREVNVGNVNIGVLLLFDESNRAVVSEVNRFGSFGKAGVTVGDVILNIDGHDLSGPESQDALVKHIEEIGAGGDVKVELQRGEGKMTLDVKLRKRRGLALSLDDVSEVLERKIAPFV